MRGRHGLTRREEGVGVSAGHVSGGTDGGGATAAVAMRERGFPPGVTDVGIAPSFRLRASGGKSPGIPI